MTRTLVGTPDPEPYSSGGILRGTVTATNTSGSAITVSRIGEGTIRCADIHGNAITLHVLPPEGDQ